MNKKILLTGVSTVAACVLLFSTACSVNTGTQASESTAAEIADAQVLVKVKNGVLKGAIEPNGAYTWKGVPFAKPPVGALRWKAPEPVAASDKMIDATKYGAVAPQYALSFAGESFSFKASEDCLTLNIWAADRKKNNKAVMIYFHGGGYGFGSGSSPVFNGANFVKAYPDIIMVTINYRLGMFGFIDLSSIPGGADYPDGPRLGLLDQIQSIKWVKENIAAFGGNPDNITIFGESAGAGSVNTLLTMNLEKGLFQRAIMQSGGLPLTNTKSAYDKINLANTLLRETGAKNMADLIAIPEDKLVHKYVTRNKNGFTLNALLALPMRDGKAIPVDGYKAIREGCAKGIDIMVGATADETNYWLEEHAHILGTSDLKSAKPAFLKNVIKPHINHTISMMNAQEKATLKKYWASLPKKFTDYERSCEYVNDLIFRVPSLIVAADHSKAGGKSYVYYFGKESTKPELKACHSVEVAYVFNNPEQTVFSGKVDKELAKKVSNMWANFARTGNPSIAGVNWEPYDTKSRKTLVIGNDNSIRVVNDYLGKQRLYMEDFVTHGHYWELASYICGWEPENLEDYWNDSKESSH